MNSVLVEFEDGQRVVTSRHAVRLYVDSGQLSLGVS